MRARKGTGAASANATAANLRTARGRSRPARIGRRLTASLLGLVLIGLVWSIPSLADNVVVTPTNVMLANANGTTPLTGTTVSGFSNPSQPLLVSVSTTIGSLSISQDLRPHAQLWLQLVQRLELLLRWRSVRCPERPRIAVAGGHRHDGHGGRDRDRHSEPERHRVAADDRSLLRVRPQYDRYVDPGAIGRADPDLRQPARLSRLDPKCERQYVHPEPPQRWSGERRRHLWRGACRARASVCASTTA